MDYDRLRVPPEERKTPTRRQVQRYMETLDKLLGDYQFAGIQGLGLVPDFLVESAAQPQPYFTVCFRAAGELHSYFGTYGQHVTYLMLAQQRGNK